MPRIHRKSLLLYNRIDARPLRQPFFDYAADDDVVAAYLRFDNVVDLNKFRLLSPIIYYPIARSNGSITHEDERNLIALIQEVMWFSGYKNKFDVLMTAINDTFEAGTLSGNVQKFALELMETLFVFQGEIIVPEDDDFPQRLARRFNLIYENHGRLLFPPLGQDLAISIPDGLKGDYYTTVEPALKIAFAMLSTKFVTKPSVWNRMFPGCVAVSLEDCPESAWVTMENLAA